MLSSSSRQENAPSDLVGPLLLKTLAGFIQAFIPTNVHNSNDHCDEATALALEGKEGMDLLKSLEAFIGVIVAPSAGVTDVDDEEDTTTHLDSTPISSDSTPLTNPSQDIPVEIKEEVHKHVYNEMPIRVLAFDSDGGQIQLLERSAVVNLILSRYVQEKNSDTQKSVTDLARYAILSHTWIRDLPGDVIYGEWDARELPVHRRGYAKVTNFCKVAAREHGVSFGWMDTICIDKESSAELDESIRSMYRWYRIAHICITYTAETTELKSMHLDSWFTRGWTLQELLAPREVAFYNKNWELVEPGPTDEINDPQFQSAFPPNQSARIQLLLRLLRNKEIKEKGSFLIDPDAYLNCRIAPELQYQIFKATTITRAELLVLKMDPKMMPPSRIMQLAANRRVTREEDMIYSLMGLLGVGIPIAYGEGSNNAFTRLIREIMTSKQRFRDIFNHQSQQNGHTLIPSSITNYLHRSSAFDNAQGGFGSTLDMDLSAEPIIFTHLGVRIPLLLIPAFRKDMHPGIPEASFDHVVGFENRSLQFREYIFLKDDEFSDQMIKGLSKSTCHPRVYAHIVFFGVINFSTHSPDYVLKPTICLSIPVALGAAPWHSLPVKISEVVRCSGPVVLSPVRGPSSERFDQADLKRRGMQILALHIK